MRRMNLGEYCEKAQEGLYSEFWNEQRGVYEQHLPANQEDKFVYWWHAHVIDVLLDGYIRTKDKKYMERIRAELAGTYRENGYTFLNNWYDDMEWMALAQLRLYDVTEEKQYLDKVLVIWEDIKTAWNEHQSGGLAWKKDQLDYKNTPANAPAAILAYRLYQRLGRDEDLAWGNRIFEWNRDHLMNLPKGIVYDGINRLGDGKIDYEWDFTYCQGVMVGAALERYRIGNKQEDFDLALRIATAAKERLCDAFGGVIPYEGKDDCGLFKGIMIRYFTELVLSTKEATDIKEMILDNARVICEKGMDERGIIGAELNKKPQDTVDLAQHLSGMMILEMAQQLRLIT